MESSPLESKQKYGSLLHGDSKSPSSTETPEHRQIVEEKEEVTTEEELEMEKLVFNCDERIFAEQDHRLFRNLHAFSLRSFDDERMRAFYHRIFWVTVVVVVMLVFLRCAYVYASIHGHTTSSTEE